MKKDEKELLKKENKKLKQKIKFLSKIKFIDKILKCKENM